MRHLLLLSLFFSISYFAKANISSDFRLVVAKCISQIQEAEKEASLHMTGGCSCANYSCGCCGHIEQSSLHLNDTGCLNITYIPEKFGISVKFTLDGSVIFSEEASASDPPPLCFGLPHLIGVGMCIKFYNLSLANHSFSGCVMVQLKGFVRDTYKLGCFKLHFPVNAAAAPLLADDRAMRLSQPPTNNLVVVAKKNPDMSLRFRPEKRTHKAFRRGPQILIN